MAYTDKLKAVHRIWLLFRRGDEENNDLRRQHQLREYVAMFSRSGDLGPSNWNGGKEETKSY